VGPEHVVHLLFTSAFLRK